MVSGILGMTLLTYMTVAQSEHVSSVRSQSWHKALVMAEAGVEEALAKMNGAGVSGPAGSGSGGPSFGPLHREFDGGAYDVRVDAAAGAGATIYATGYVAIPALSSTVSRAIVVATTNGPLFTTAVAAQTNLTMSSHGSGLTFSDSFDSGNPQLGNRTNGEVACLAGSVNLGSSKIAGNLLLGSTVTSNSGQVEGSVFHDLNLELPDVVVPSPYWVPAAATNQIIDGTTYRYVFNKWNSGDYLVNAPGSIYVGPDAKVKLQVISSGFSAPSVYLAGTDWHASSLVIYALGAGFSLGDATVESGKASRLVYLGLPGNTSLTLNDNTTFTGTIYAPAADFTNNVVKGKNKKASFTGSCIAKSVRINGTAAFHFDEDLLRNSPMTRGFVITSWKEL